MPQYGDDLYLGNAANLYPTPLNTSADPRRPGTGVGPLGRVHIFDLVPAALAANNLSVSASPGAGAIVLAAGAGVTAVVDYAGVTRYTLDCARAIRYVSGGDDTGITFTATGYDFYGQAQTETVTGANGTATGLKTWQSITGITHTGSVASTLTVGTTDKFGLPYAISDVGYIQSVKWNETLASDAGTFVVADATSPATSLTGDVRGTYTPSANASNGTRRLVIGLALTGIQVGPNATTLGAFGVTPA